MYLVRMDNMALAHQIDELRRADDRSVKWLAENASIALSTLKRKLDGVGDFTLPELWRIANALKVEPASVLPAEFAKAA